MNEVCFNLNGRPMWRGWRIEAPDVRRLINQEGPVTRAVSLNNGARRRAGRAAQLSAGHRRRLERGGSEERAHYHFLSPSLVPSSSSLPRKMDETGV